MSPPDQQKICAEKERLLGVYSFATSDYDRTIHLMHKFLWTLPQEQYDRIRQFSEDCLARCKEARDALEVHTREHGC